MNKRKILFCWIFSFAQVTCNLADAKTIQIALVIPMTGNYAGYGNQLLAGASQAAKDINKIGGILGDKLEVIPYDDRCQASIASTLSKKLAKDPNIHAIIGHVTSSATLAAIDNYAKTGKLLLTATATNPKITEKNIPTVFRISGRDDRQGIVIATFMANTLQSKRIAILHDEDLYGKNLADYVTEHLAALDQHPVLYQGIPRGIKDLSKLIDKFKALKIDAIFFAALYPDVGNLAKAMHKAQLQIPLLTGDGIALHSFVIAAGSRHATAAVMMSFGDNTKNITSLAVIENMRHAHLETNGYTMYAYSAVQAIAAAMQATKSTNGKNLAKWLHHNTVDTVFGLKSWDTNGDISDAGYKMYIWNNYGDYQQIL